MAHPLRRARAGRRRGGAVASAVTPAAFVAAMGTLLAACGAQRGGSPDTAATTVRAPLAAGCQDGVTPLRGGLLRTPAGAHTGTTPLVVVVMPGGRGDPGDRLGIARAALEQGFAVLYPTRPNGGFWTLNREQGTTDVRAVDALLQRVLADGCMDPRRVSITGVSNGGGFAARLSCELPSRFAAVVPVAAGFRALDPCPRAARGHFLAIHGSADTVVPYNGKKPDGAGSVPRYAGRRARLAGCRSRPRETRPAPGVMRLVFVGCDAGLRVGVLRLAETDHGWPGAGPPLPQRNPSGVSATAELLRFVRTARRRD